MSRSYGQFCPVAKAAEILAERWTPLVVRELLCGSRRFNDIRRGVPQMSPTLLSQRLRTLEEEGLVERGPVAGDTVVEYRLTPAGQALQPVIEGLGTWGKRWVRREIRSEELDAGLLMWDIHRRLRLDRVPEGRTVLRFELTDRPSKQRFYWLVIEQNRVDICLKDPGFEVDLYIGADLRTLTGIWLGDVAFESALHEGWLTLHGPRYLVRRFRSWLALSVFAHIERKPDQAG
ncbi:MAG: helix-turn-helix domain-containing protein [Candidatus Competibacterales bacterium]|nr:helix-turn-helix domain-containing protein [Candidatus Competibacterales bacterium]